MTLPFKLALLALAVLLPGRGHAALFEAEKPKPIDWEEVKRQPALVLIENARPEQLAPGSRGDAWAKIPDALRRLAAVVHMPVRKHLGVAEYRVLASGWILLACNWDYQGNSSGNWKTEQVTEADLVARGWRKLGESETGGRLVKGDGRAQTVFIKKVAKGEEGRLRCNKYDPPYFIAPSVFAGE